MKFCIDDWCQCQFLWAAPDHNILGLFFFTEFNLFRFCLCYSNSTGSMSLTDTNLLAWLFWPLSEVANGQRYIRSPSLHRLHQVISRPSLFREMTRVDNAPPSVSRSLDRASGGQERSGSASSLNLLRLFTRKYRSDSADRPAKRERVGKNSINYYPSFQTSFPSGFVEHRSRRRALGCVFSLPVPDN